MIDRDRIEELRTEMGHSGVTEMIALFESETAEALSRLAASPSKTEAAEELHFIRGMALNVGANKLAELCRDGEFRLAQGDSDVPTRALAEAFLLSNERLLDVVAGGAT